MKSAFIAALMAAATMTADASSSPTRTAAVEVDSVSYRTDLTRVYCKITGRPHTSDRVDAATLTSGGITLNANDIDGIDFKRYFQWEDDGSIPLEIDFPPVDKKAATLTLKTLRGDISTHL